MARVVLPSLTIQTKLGLAFGVLVLGVFAVMGWAAGRWAEAHVLELHVKRLHESASRMATALDIGMFERLREITNLAASTRPEDANGALSRADLERLQSTYPLYAWIGVTDAGGTVTAATGGLLEGRDVSERPWWRNAATTAAVGDFHEAKLLSSLLPPTNDGGPHRLLDVSAPISVGPGRTRSQIAWRVRSTRTTGSSSSCSVPVERICGCLPDRVLPSPSMPI